MPVNGLSVGKDFNFGLYDGNTGTIVDFGDVQSVKVTAQKHDLKSMPYNDVPRFAYIGDGYKLAVTITRTGSQLEDLQVQLQQAFNQGQSSKAGYLNETINDADGVKVYQYRGVVWWLTEVVDVSRDKVVTQQVEGFASDKIRLS